MVIDLIYVHVLNVDMLKLLTTGIPTKDATSNNDLPFPNLVFN